MSALRAGAWLLRVLLLHKVNFARLRRAIRDEASVARLVSDTQG